MDIIDTMKISLPYKVMMEERLSSTKMESWLNQNISGDWDRRYHGLGIYEFNFENEEDAVAFKLRWS